MQCLQDTLALVSLRSVDCVNRGDVIGNRPQVFGESHGKVNHLFCGNLE